MKFVHCRRVVTYLPNIRAAVISSRTFSSQRNDFREYPAIDASEDSTSVKTVWPDHTLGPLGPQDKRFPLPGRIGPCATSNTSRVTVEFNSRDHQDLQNQLNLSEALPKTAEHRHEVICEQFLTSVDEIELEFLDQNMSDSSEKTTPGPTDKMELRAHSCPTLLRKDFKELFPNKNIMEGNFTVVVISFKTDTDQTLWSSEVEEEREKLLESYIHGAVEICQAFEDSGYWADFIDPTSGKPFKGPHTNFTLFETDERYRKLGFDIKDLGCCKVVSHPVWGSHAYIGALFTDAPISHPLVNSMRPV